MKKILKRYHKTIFFPPYFEKDMDKLLKNLTRRNWLWGFHAIKKLLESVDKSTAKEIINFVYDLKIDINDVFEVYYNEDLTIEKFCVRVSLDNVFDLILVISKEKTIITLYVNPKNRNHNNLDEKLYLKE